MNIDYEEERRLYDQIDFRTNLNYNVTADTTESENLYMSDNEGVAEIRKILLSLKDMLRKGSRQK
jgi:hypothetical protein